MPWMRRASQKWQEHWRPAVADVVDIPRASELPRTGSSTPWLPIAGATMIAAAVVTRRFVLRTR